MIRVACTALSVAVGLGGNLAYRCPSSKALGVIRPGTLQGCALSSLRLIEENERPHDSANYAAVQIRVVPEKDLRLAKVGSLVFDLEIGEIDENSYLICAQERVPRRLQYGGRDLFSFAAPATSARCCRDIETTHLYRDQVPKWRSAKRALISVASPGRCSPMIFPLSSSAVRISERDIRVMVA